MFSFCPGGFEGQAFRMIQCSLQTWSVCGLSLLQLGIMRRQLPIAVPFTDTLRQQQALRNGETAHLLWRKQSLIAGLNPVGCRLTCCSGLCQRRVWGDFSQSGQMILGVGHTFSSA
ncbi:hypothetical protein D3C81_1792940 [compost metagenome]